MDEPVPTQDVSVEVLASGLTNPWGLAFLPDGRMLVAERPGDVRILGADGALSDPIPGVPEVYDDSQAGLFDVVLHPEFEANAFVYLTYAEGDKDSNALRVARARFDGEALQDLEVLWELSPRKKGGAHYGGRLVFLPDGTFVVTTGEGYRYRDEAQKLDNALGKMIRLNADGSIPSDNPFLGREDALPEIYSYGHRNPQGLLYDDVTGRLIAHEHGPQGGDEINIVEPGANYGWPIACYCKDYSGAQITPFEKVDGTTQPILYWRPSIAPSGFAIVRGDLFKDWEGDFLVGALAYNELRRVDMEGGAPVDQRSLLKDRDERVRDVRIGPDGAIYALVAETKRGGEDGKVLRITP